MSGHNADGAAVHIVSNPNLRSLHGLRDLQGNLEGALDISNNTVLRNLDGLQQVLGVGKDVRGVSITIEGNTALTSTSGMTGLHGHIPGSIRVLRNPSLHVLAGLQRVWAVDEETSTNQPGHALAAVGALQDTALMCNAACLDRGKQYFGLEDENTADGAAAPAWL